MQKQTCAKKKWEKFYCKLANVWKWVWNEDERCIEKKDILKVYIEKHHRNLLFCRKSFTCNWVCERSCKLNCVLLKRSVHWELSIRFDQNSWCCQTHRFIRYEFCFWFSTRHISRRKSEHLCFFSKEFVDSNERTIFARRWSSFQKNVQLLKNSQLILWTHFWCFDDVMNNEIWSFAFADFDVKCCSKKKMTMI